MLCVGKSSSSRQTDKQAFQRVQAGLITTIEFCVRPSAETCMRFAGCVRAFVCVGLYSCIHRGSQRVGQTKVFCMCVSYNKTTKLKSMLIHSRTTSIHAGPRVYVGTIVYMCVCVGRTDLEAFRLTPHATVKFMVIFATQWRTRFANQCQGVLSSYACNTHTHPYRITSGRRLLHARRVKYLANA